MIIIVSQLTTCTPLVLLVAGSVFTDALLVSSLYVLDFVIKIIHG